MHLYNKVFIKIMTRVSVPSAVSSMLERLCPRLMPLTAGGRSTREPLSWGVEDVTSGGTLFSGAENMSVKHMLSTTTISRSGAIYLSLYLCACGPEHRPTRRRQAGAGAAAVSWALHGRGLRKQTRTWRSFGRNGWSSNRGSADSGRAVHWELPFCAASPHPLMQKTCLRERHHRSNHIFSFFDQAN